MYSGTEVEGAAGVVYEDTCGHTHAQTHTHTHTHTRIWVLILRVGTCLRVLLALLQVLCYLLSPHTAMYVC
jgi:hypothetical protein